MIRIILPPADRPPECAFVQRTTSLCKMLEMLGEDFITYPPDVQFLVSTGDMVFYTFPNGQPQLIPGTIPVECGIGYDRPPFGAFRVFETNAWRHFHFGKYPHSLNKRRNSWVLPWAFDPSEWPVGTGAGGYVAMLTRLALDKGLSMLRDVANRADLQEFKIAGVGEFPSGMPPNVEFVGPIHGAARARFLGNAKAFMQPTEYVEPFGGSAVEAMLCGTPALASSFGGFTETVTHGVNGWLCNSAGEFVKRIGSAAVIDRSLVRASTEASLTLGPISERWRVALEQMRELPWYDGSHGGPI